MNSGEETLAFLRNQPQFQHMRTLLQQNPTLLPELLQQIGRSNPTLLQVPWKLTPFCLQTSLSLRHCWRISDKERVNVIKDYI